MASSVNDLSVEQMLVIDKLCDRLESSLRRKSTLEIEQCLRRVAPELRQVAFEELVCTELSVKATLDLTITDFDSYYLRFPEYEDVLREIIPN